MAAPVGVPQSRAQPFRFGECSIGRLDVGEPAEKGDVALQQPPEQVGQVRGATVVPGTGERRRVAGLEARPRLQQRRGQRKVARVVGHRTQRVSGTRLTRAMTRPRIVGLWGLMMPSEPMTSDAAGGGPGRRAEWSAGRRLAGAGRRTPTDGVPPSWPRTAPPWLARAALTVTLVVLGVLLVVDLVGKLRGLLILVLASFFIGCAMEPLVNRLAARGWRRSRATGLVFLGVLVVLAAFVAVMGRLLVGQVRTLWKHCRTSPGRRPGCWTNGSARTCRAAR